MTARTNLRLIESDTFRFEFLSQLAERESWRKEVHRPVYHVHKWWAKRLGSVFRGILLGSLLPETADLEEEFYSEHDFSLLKVFDPFMGSGTTVGEAHKLGCIALGRDINPVAVEAVRVALGPLNRAKLDTAFDQLSLSVGAQISALYRTTDSAGRAADVLYFFWVMQATCPHCFVAVDLFPSYVIASNAYPMRKPEVQVLCPVCGDVFQALHSDKNVPCRCGHSFDPDAGSTRGAKARCANCETEFAIKQSLGGARPTFRLYGKLVLTSDGKKEYLASSSDDRHAYGECARRLAVEDHSLPTLALEDGLNTRQAINYGFVRWRDFFNDRQLLALSLLHSAIQELVDSEARRALLTLFSGVLEFNNLFASYKGEGTGAVRHMFAHHILKPERTPIEAHLWGTPKSSGSFSNLYRTRLVRALDYREAPSEVNGVRGKGVVCSPPFSGRLAEWGKSLHARTIALSCGDSSATGLPSKSVDVVVTDPPFFDNVHYSELADFFYAWQQLGREPRSTRSKSEVQDSDAARFAEKLRGVFQECERLLKDDGLLVFTYHHSRDEGWRAVAAALLGAGFVVVNSHPVKAEMSVATPKSQAKEPIQLDIILVCRKAAEAPSVSTIAAVMEVGREKLQRLQSAGFRLSRNDRRIVYFGQLLATARHPKDLDDMAWRVEEELSKPTFRPAELMD